MINSLDRSVCGVRIWKGEATYRVFCGNEVILSIYCAMLTAIRTGRTYQTLLDPLSGPPVDADGNFVTATEWDSNNWPKHIHAARSGGAHEV